MSQNNMETERIVEPVHHHKRRHRKGMHFAWSGVFLVVVGLAFFMKNTGFVGNHFNWWAFFILLPAFIFLNIATTIFQRSGYYLLGVRFSFATGLISLAVAFMFLLNLDWAIWWPVMLVVPGFVMITNGFSRKLKDGIQFSRWVSIYFWVGVAVFLLGLCFLLQQLELVDLNRISGRFQWWGFFILLPGLGSILSGFLNYLRAGRRPGPENAILLIFGLVCSCTGILAVSGLPWSLLVPLYLIGTGVIFLLKYLYDIRVAGK